ncbi:hypothetical protein C0Z18_13245 [Trinickia dabaoshanensis]|uniref:Uncharacterized protein n=1 Tax=Trinickia dabaoshanensis TaxID=564714 RepID=A0A2N7VRK1_9BURK|nr:hypothetical protein [Trinickia dabaoshanensis]PMS19782.1 hypothetical protein C0Z18_13245 [Trinickia dabaoshanensis]
MKPLQYLALSLSLCAVAAHAQNHAPESVAASTSSTPSTLSAAGAQDAAHPAGRVERRSQASAEDRCVGPVSFCNTYFGS